MPERNVPAEITLQLGAGGILALSAALLLMSFVALVFNDTGSSINGLASLAFLLFSINLAAQGTLAFREFNRVDHYKERIMACVLITLPIVIYVMYTAFVSLSRYIIPLDRRVELYESINLSAIMYVTLTLSVIGSVWFWFLLRDKNKLVWIVKPINRSKRADINTKQQLDRNKKLGYIFLLAPVALFILRILISVPIGLMGNDGAIFTPLLFLVHWALELLWLPSIITGIILLRKQK